MNVEQLLNLFFGCWLLPLVILAAFLFFAGRSPFHAAARTHWLMTTAILSAFFALLCSIISPKFWSIPIPYWIGDGAELFVKDEGAYILFSVYIFGLVWSASYFFLGLNAVRRLTANAKKINYVSVLKPLLGKVVPPKNVSFRVSSEVTSPLMWGWRQPVILLPEQFKQWDSARIQRVLLHEFSHVQRGDWGLKFISQLICCFLWYLPLVWYVARKLDWHAELACDDEVIKRFNCRAEYANDLLDISANSKHIYFALALNKGSKLYARINSVLDGCRSRDSWSVKKKSVLVAMAFLSCIPLAGLHASIAAGALTEIPISKALYPLIIVETNEFLGEHTGKEAIVDSAGSGGVYLVGVTPKKVQEMPGKPLRISEEIVVYGKPLVKQIAKKTLSKVAFQRVGIQESPKVVSSGYLPVKMVTPVYPKKAIARGIEGKVIAQFDVNELGGVENIRIAYAEPKRIFNRSVKSAIKQSKFLPLFYNGENIKTKNVTETFVFTLKNDTTDNQTKTNFSGRTEIASKNLGDQ